MTDGPSRELSSEATDSSVPLLPSRVDGPAAGESSGSQTNRRKTLLERLPWEKALIWGLIFGLVYVLRSFFFTLFMTFLLCYIVRSIVVKTQSLISPYQERVWLERTLTLACFSLIILGLLQVGKFVGPELQDQAKELYDRVSKIDYEKEFHGVLNNTVGRMLFESTYGDEESDEYQVAFTEFREKGLRVVDYDKFHRLRRALRDPFDVKTRAEARKRIDESLRDGTLSDAEFDAWFRVNKAAEILDAQQDQWISRWEARYEKDSKLYPQLIPLEELRLQPDFAEKRRDGMLQMVVDDWRGDEAKRATDREEWRADLVAESEERLLADPKREEEFEIYYEEQRKLNESEIVYDYPTYRRLELASADGREAFSRLLQEIDNLTETVDEEELVRKQHLDFRAEEYKRLTAEWRQGDLYKSIQGYVRENAATWVAPLEQAGKRTLDQFIALPPQIALVFLLSLFITLDMAKLRRGIEKLKRSRVRNFYDEIAPGLINFGRLIGRSFLAQGVIAICNTVLTYLVIKMLGIGQENEYFLCAIVFLCSFIPVLGVVISSVPIAIVAIVQPGGSVWLALQAIIGILVIHFIETSLLNPKIIGDMLHLHPVMVLVCLAIGEHFFGVWGLLLAVPVAVYIYRFVILNEGIPGLIEPVPAAGAAVIDVHETAATAAKRELDSGVRRPAASGESDAAKERSSALPPTAVAATAGSDAGGDSSEKDGPPAPASSK